jgi:hypothetical protein
MRKVTNNDDNLVLYIFRSIHNSHYPDSLDWSSSYLVLLFVNNLATPSDRPKENEEKQKCKHRFFYKKQNMIR